MQAAWGERQKQDTQLAIRSYEFGVLFVPEGDETLERDEFLPYDFPLMRYGTRDTPWLADGTYEEPDCHGVKCL